MKNSGKTKCTVICLILSLMLVMSACKGGGNTNPIPDPTPDGSGDPQDNAVMIDFGNFYEDEYSGVFKPDGVFSMEMSVADGKAVFSRADDTATYGSYAINLTLDTVGYKYLVFDVDSLNNEFNLKIYDSLWNDYQFFSTKKPGKIYADLSILPAEMIGRKVTIKFYMFLVGKKSIGSKVVLNSIYTSNDEPAAAVYRSSFNFNDEGIEKEFYCSDNMDFRAEGGRGIFSVASGPGNEQNAAIFFDVKINVSQNRYFVFNIEDQTANPTIIIGLDGSTVRLLDEGRYAGVKYFDMQKNFPEALTEGEQIVTIRIFIYHDGSAVLKLNSIYQTNSLGALHYRTAIDFEDGDESIFVNAVNNMTLLVDGGKGTFDIPNVAQNGGNVVGSMEFEFVINAGENRYLVFDMDTTDGFPTIIVREKSTGTNILSEGKYFGKAFGDLSGLPAKFLTGEQTITVMIFLYHDTLLPDGTNNRIPEGRGKLVLDSIYQVNDLDDIGYKSGIDFEDGDELYFVGSDSGFMTSDDMSVSVDNNRGTFTVDNNVEAAFYFDLHINYNQNKYLAFDIAGSANIKIDLSGTYSSNGINLLGKAFYSGTVYYDLSKFVDSTQPGKLKTGDKVITVKVTVFGNGSEFVLNSIYQANTLSAVANTRIDFNEGDAKFFSGAVNNMTLSVNDGKGEFTVPARTSNNNNFFGAIDFDLVVNVSVNRYLVLDIDTTIGFSTIIVREKTSGRNILSEARYFGKAFGDLAELPEELREGEQLVTFVITLYDTTIKNDGTRVTLEGVAGGAIGSGALHLNSIYQVNSTAELGLRSRIDFTDADETVLKAGSASSPTFTPPAWVDISIDDGRGIFAITTALGAIYVDLLINYSENRYIVLDMDAQQRIRVDISGTYASTGNVLLAEGNYSGLTYIDLGNITDGQAKKLFAGEKVITLKIIIMGAAPTDLVLNSIYQTNTQ